MKLGVALLILNLSFLFPAKAASLNPCQEAGISVFQVFGIGTWDWDDHCKRDPKNYHPEWLTVIHQIKEINKATAKILGTTVEELFGPRKLNILISLDPLGNLGSFVSAESGDLVLGEFAEFSGKNFNRKIYAHELIHWIAQQPGTPLNENLGTLSDHLLFRETIPDWISTLVTGITEVGLAKYDGMEIPGCLKDVRFPVKISDPAANFHFASYLGNQLACCIANLKLMHANESLETFCETIQENSQIQNNIVPATAAWAEPFNPDVCAGKDCDPHQFSSLLTPFLLGTQKLSKVSLVPSFLELAKANPDHPRAILKNLGNFLPEDQKVKFKALWKKHDPKFYD